MLMHCEPLTKSSMNCLTVCPINTLGVGGCNHHVRYLKTVKLINFEIFSLVLLDSCLAMLLEGDKEMGLMS